MTYQIRHVIPSDLPEMFRISVSAHQAGYAALIPDSNRKSFDERYAVTPENERNYTEFMTAGLNDHHWSSWLAEQNGRVVGYVLMERVHADFYRMRGMFVDPDYQGQGIGSGLMQTALNSVQKGTIELHVIAANERAKHIYEKNGFVVTSESPETFFGAKQDIMTFSQSPQ